MPKIESAVKEVKAPVKRKTKGYKLPKPIPKGEVLTDLKKSKWVIGSSVGVGGFGEIYSAFSESQKEKDAPYVIKIEPHGNGPLFVEMHFYMRVGKREDIEEWMKKHKVAHLGIPSLYGSGSHECNDEKYRFIVIDRYGKDLWSLFEDNARRFPVPTVFKIGLQIVDVLQYIHEKGYIHGDVKGKNLLLGYKKGNENKVFLVDFGLAEKYSTKEFKPDKKRAHNGTIEYTSRDAHLGVPTRRGDLEILGFNLLQWIVSYLPWEKNLTNPVTVQQQKEEFMANISANIKKLKSNVMIPGAIGEFLKYVKNLEHDEEPDYDKCRQILKDGLKTCGEKLAGSLVFKDSVDKPGRTPKKTQKKATKRNSSMSDSENDDNDDGDFEEEPKKKRKVATPSKKGKTAAVTPKRTPRAAKAKSQTPSSESEECEGTDSEEEPPKKGASTKKRQTKKVVNGTDSSSRMSWRDFPTIVASNVVRAGEYTKKDGEKTSGARNKR